MSVAFSPSAMLIIDRTSRGIDRVAPFTSFTDDYTDGLAGATAYARAGAAGYIGSDASWHSVAADVPRIDGAWGYLSEIAATNAVRNNSAQGASAGTMPTNWPLPTTGAGSLNSGLTWTVVGTGTASGMEYVRYRINGTPSSTFGAFVFFEGATQIVAAQGEVWTNSIFWRTESGSWGAGAVGPRLSFTERTSGGGILASQTDSIVQPTAAVLGTQRRTYTVTLQNASTGRLQPNVLITVVSGQAIDVTFDLAFAQTEKTPFATSPIRTTAAAVARAMDAASIALPLPAASYAAAGTAAVRAIAAAGSGTRVLWQLCDGTESNRLRIWRDSSRVVRVLATVAGADVVDMAVSTVADGAAFTVKLTWNGGLYAAAVDATSSASASAAPLASTMTTLLIGKDTTGNQWGGWLVNSTIFTGYAAIPTPAWVDAGAVMSMDFANQRNFNPATMNFTRSSVSTGYDSSGALVTFASQVPVVPAYNPNDGNKALGIGVFLFNSNWWANSATPATQTVTPTVNDTYVAYCYGSGSINLTGGVTRTLAGSAAANGFFGASLSKFTLNGATAVTATVVGTVTFMQLANISYQSPEILSVGAPATRNTDVITISLAANPNRIDTRRGAVCIRSFVSQIQQAATFLALTDGTDQNRLAINYKTVAGGAPSNASGITAIAAGITTGAVDPDPPYEIDAVGYHTSVCAWDIAPDGSGTLRMSTDGSPVKSGSFTAGKLPLVLNEIGVGIDRASGIFSQPLSGYIQRITTFGVIDDARMTALSAVTGP